MLLNPNIIGRKSVACHLTTEMKRILYGEELNKFRKEGKRLEEEVKIKQGGRKKKGDCEESVVCHLTTQMKRILQRED